MPGTARALWQRAWAFGTASTRGHAPTRQELPLPSAARALQDAGTEVVQAKAGAGSATLSMAYAAARFAEACLRAMAGEGGVVECAYVASSLTSLPFFAAPVRLGRGGAEELLPLGPMNDLEQVGAAGGGLGAVGGGWAGAVGARRRR